MKQSKADNYQSTFHNIPEEQKIHLPEWEEKNLNLKRKLKSQIRSRPLPPLLPCSLYTSHPIMRRYKDCPFYRDPEPGSFIAFDGFMLGGTMKDTFRVISSLKLR
jgi:hypothetical protein